MPVTAKLSKQFYDRLGEVVANELVDWFNQVDAAYKSDLREMNDLNFARFDAKLDQQLTASEARVDQRLTASEAKVDQRLAASDAKHDQRLAEFRADNDRHFSELRAEVRALDSRLDVSMSALRPTIEKGLREQTRFFFLAWAVLLASIVALRFR